jgi:hypothetical protein
VPGNDGGFGRRVHETLSQEINKPGKPIEAVGGDAIPAVAGKYFGARPGAIMGKAVSLEYWRQGRDDGVKWYAHRSWLNLPAVQIACIGAHSQGEFNISIGALPGL